MTIKSRYETHEFHRDSFVDGDITNFELDLDASRLKIFVNFANLLDGDIPEEY